MPHPFLDCGGRPLQLSTPRVMGILNVTPDSFSDGGRFAAVDLAVSRGFQMWEEGAAILDVGGESTRPGAADVQADEEIARVVPVIEALSRAVPIPISVDTSKAEVMEAAVRAGAGLINDVYALRRPGALQMAADLGVPVCLMHMQGEPRTMQLAPDYNDVSREVLEFLQVRRRPVWKSGSTRAEYSSTPVSGSVRRWRTTCACLRSWRVSSIRLTRWWWVFRGNR